MEYRSADGTARERYEWLVDAPPSAKLVYRVLDHVGEPLSSEELAERTRLSERTTRYALKRLRDADVVTVTQDPTDPRKRTYELEPVEGP